MPDIFQFSTSGDVNETYEKALEMRDAQMIENGKVFSGDQLEQDNARVRKTLDFLFAAGPGFSGYIANKPEIENWREALGTWVNDAGGLGVGEKNPVKSLVYKRKNSEEVFVVVMPNDLELPKDFLKKNNLGRYNFPESDGVVIPRTINPGTVTMLDAPITFAIHEKMSEVGYCCNNLGSRYLSYSVTAVHHASAVENLASANKFSFNGTTKDFEEKYSKMLEISEVKMGEERPSSVVKSRGESKGFTINHFAGDYFKYGREE